MNSLRTSVLILFAACSFGANAAPATGQQYHLTLQEAIDKSIAASKQLRYSRAKVAEADAMLKEARDRRLPDVTASGSYLRLNQPNVTLKVNTGGDGNNNNGDNDPQEESNPTVSQAMYGRANVSLPLFAGFGIRSGIESARYLAKAATLDDERDREEMIQNTIEAYSNLYKAQAAVVLMQENLKQSQERVRQLTSLEQNGLLARNGLLKAQLQSSNIELTLLDAQNNARIAAVNMSLMLGLPEDTPVTVDSLSAMPDEKAFASWEESALTNRKDLAAQALRIQAADAGIDAEKSAYYPSLALTGGYVAAYVPNLLTITNAVNVGVGVRYSLSSLWKTDAKVAQAKARKEQAEAYEAVMSDNIRLELAKQYQEYTLNTQKISVYEQAVAQAEENYRIVKNKYDNALATTTELLDADVALLQAKLNRAYGKADATVSYNKLLLSAGLLGGTSK